MAVERVGVVLVHGIGEQKRFEHLDSQVRSIIAALKVRARNANHPKATPDDESVPSDITVEILSGSGAAYRSEQETWASGRSPSVRINVRMGYDTTQICVHEVWWADINEPYSLAKQFRFWLWGLSVWLVAGAPSRPDLPNFGKTVLSPTLPGRGWVQSLAMRLQLYLVGLFFLISAFSVGIAGLLAKRLLGIELIDPVKVFTNYISGVKLYNQPDRWSAGIFPRQQDFLDTLEDPPRTSIRRRMVRGILAAAAADYDRWYILAHSLGSVVALNGIMEPGQALANYLNHDEWREACGAGLAGPATPEDVVPAPGKMMPVRPVWLGDRDVVYRQRLFKTFRGLLTYGSPIEKFAALWPARVVVNKCETPFGPDIGWINICDSCDPVAGMLEAYEVPWLRRSGITPRHCPELRSFGYASGNIALVNHLQYFRDVRPGRPADLVAGWLLTDQFPSPVAGQNGWFAGAGGTFRARQLLCAAEFTVVFVCLSLLGTTVATWLAVKVAGYLPAPMPDAVERLHGITYPSRVVGFVALCAAAVLAAGVVRALSTHPDPPQPHKPQVPRAPRAAS